MKFKKIILSSVLAIGIAKASGIPTFDFGVLTESVMQHNETLQQWQNQLKEMEKHYNAISGINSWSDLLNSDYFWDFFPKEADEIAKGNADTSEVLKEINDAIKDDESFRKFKEKELNQIANRKERASENYQAAMDRKEELDDLIKEAKNNETAKDSLDYNNMMQGKIALILNELSRLTVEAQINDAEQMERNKIEDERAKEAMDMSQGAKVYPI